MKSICIVFTLLVAIWSAFSIQATAVPPQSQVKIFSLQSPNRVQKHKLLELNDPLVYGVSWRFHWKTIEPQEGQYHWDLIDQAIHITSNADKKVMLRVVAGRRTPAWVYQAGAQPFHFRNTDLYHAKNHPDTMVMPIPWDAVYLAKWEKLIRALGKRYNSNPHIYSVQMAGGGHIGEMNLPKGRLPSPSPR